MRRCSFVLFAVLFLAACQTSHDYETRLKDPRLYCDVVHDLNQVVMGNNFTPIVASRNYLYAAVAGYEVIAAGYPGKYRSLAGQLRGLDSVPQPPVGQKIDFELAAMLAYCKLGEAVTFPKGSMQVTVDTLRALALDHGMPQEVLDQTQAYADSVGAAIMRWSRKDHYLETRRAPKYTVKDSPGRWIPTPPGYFQAAEPHWNEIRFTVVDSASEFMPHPPYPFDMTDKHSPYYEEVALIKNTVDSLTPEQAAEAEFWDDNPFRLNVYGHLNFATKKFSPGGHWMGITGIAAMKSGADFQKTVAAYAETAVALFDAFIQCWNVKYTYNTLRPETAITKYMDPTWRPHLQTPPFPEYTCGHCTISAAASEALSHNFGDHFAFTDTTELEFGIKERSFPSFRDAALETMNSRFYGGIHYRYCCLLSNDMGKKIGLLVVDRLKFEK